MMQFRKYGRVASLAWLTLVASLLVCYATIVAGLVGLVGAPGVSLVSFAGAMIGCVAGLVYLISALHDIHIGHSA